MDKREKWNLYFELITEICEIANDDCEKVATNGTNILLDDNRHNRGFRGVFRVNNEAIQRELQILLEHAKILHGELTNASKLPAYFPSFLDDILYMTIKERKAISSRKYTTGKGLLCSLSYSQQNLAIAKGKELELNNIYGAEFCELIDTLKKINLKIDADIFIKKHKCNAMRVREMTCNSFYCSLYKDIKSEPVRAPLGVRFIRFNDDIEISKSPKRKQKALKYSIADAIIVVSNSTVYKE